MSRVTDQTPTEEFTIQGLTFAVPQPYVAGQLDLTEGEASALNQTFAENIRNNFAGTIQQAEVDYRKANGLAEGAEVPKDQLDKDSLTTKLAEYAKSYEFGVRSVRGARIPMDPVGREAYRIAGELIRNALKAKNVKLDSVSKEWMAQAVKDLVEAQPDITAEAKRRVDSAASFALASLATVPTTQPESSPAEAPQAA
jgi:hypothetical protein